MRRTHPIARKFVLTVLSACWPTSAQTGPCRVTVNVTDNYGNRVEAGSIRLTTDGIASYVQEDKPFQAKCGHHTLDVEVRGADHESLSINIEQLDRVVPVAPRLGAVDGPVPDCAIMGRVSGSAPARTVRLLQLFGPYLVDVPVAAARTFQVMHLKCGTYLLVAMSGKQCLGTRLVTATVSGTHVDLKTMDAIDDHCSSLRP